MDKRWIDSLAKRSYGPRAVQLRQWAIDEMIQLALDTVLPSN